MLALRASVAARAGHEVFAPTLTGLGERAHLARPEIDLDTHIGDIVAILEMEDLRDVVLVGHSYGGMVITGVADRAPEADQAPGLPRRVRARRTASAHWTTWFPSVPRACGRRARERAA